MLKEVLFAGKQVDAKLAELKNIEADHLGDDSGLAAYFKLESARLIQYIKSLPGTFTWNYHFYQTLSIHICLHEIPQS